MRKDPYEPIMMEVEVEPFSETGLKIYAACVASILSGAVAGARNPLWVTVTNGVAVVEYVDDEMGLCGAVSLEHAVSGEMIFDTSKHPDDIEDAVRDAEVLATAFEQQAKRLRDEIAKRTSKA